MNVVVFVVTRIYISSELSLSEMIRVISLCPTIFRVPSVVRTVKNNKSLTDGYNYPGTVNFIKMSSLRLVIETNIVVLLFPSKINSVVLFLVLFLLLFDGGSRYFVFYGRFVCLGRFESLTFLFSVGYRRQI